MIGNAEIPAPFWAALISGHAGEELSYNAPGGSMKIVIEEIVYQPETVKKYSQ